MSDTPAPKAMSTLDWARQYCGAGWAVVPVPHGRKGPTLSRWQHLRLEEEALPRHFSNGNNIGIIVADPSHGLIDVDLDCREACIAARYLLPPTAMVSGRKSNPRSHHWYHCDPQPDFANFDHPVPSKENAQHLLEIRGRGPIVNNERRGYQTLVPPSIHDDTGESYVWHTFGDPAEVPGPVLVTAVRRTAAATLLACAWPAKGRRHHCAMALAGMLCYAGWEHVDASTFVEAVIAAAGDDDPQDRLTCVVSTYGNIAAEKPATGTPRLAEIVGDAVVAQVRTWLDLKDRDTASMTVSVHQIIEPVSLPSVERPWPEAPGHEVFAGILGDAVASIDPYTEADPIAVLVHLLACFGCVIGRGPHCEVGATRHAFNEFFGLVGKSSKARKGDSANAARQVFWWTSPDWEQSQITNGLSSGEGLIWAVRDAITTRQPVKEKGRTTGYEDVVTDSGVADKRLLVLESELARVLKVMGRQGNTLSPILRDAWDGRPLRVLTKNSPAKSTGAHISLVGHATVDELRRELSDTESTNGFANRFVWFAVRRSKELPEPAVFDGEACGSVVSALTAAIDYAANVKVMRRDEDASALWRSVYHTLSREEPGLLGSLRARAEAHTLRLSALYALLDCSDVIRAEHLRSALALWAYAEDSLGYLFGDATGDAVADTVLAALRANGPMDRSQIRSILDHHITASRISQALALLVTSQKASVRHERTNGRSREVWVATCPA